MPGTSLCLVLDLVDLVDLVDPDDRDGCDEVDAFVLVGRSLAALRFLPAMLRTRCGRCLNGGQKEERHCEAAISARNRFVPKKT